MIKATWIYSIWLMLFLLLTSCSATQEKSNAKQVTVVIPELFSEFDLSIELTQAQQRAFDALNTLQVSTDEKNMLYSTFAGIPQPCYPADSNFTILRSELLIVLGQFVTTHCKNLTIEERTELAESVVLAQESKRTARYILRK